jgi:hypothetical protein
MIFARTVLLASLLGLLALAPTSSTATTHPLDPTQAKVVVEKQAPMSSSYWVRLRVHCFAPQGFTCDGEILLGSATARIAGVPVGIAAPRRYRVGGGKARFVAVRLGSELRADHPPRHAGGLWIEAWVFAKAAEGSKRRVLVRWKGPPR